MHVVIAGLTNTYSSYITTYEEYQVQRYEGGFTLYGPHTLDAYIQEFMKLSDCMLGKAECQAGPRPPNQLDEQWSLVPGVIFDSTPYGYDFGDITVDANDKYKPGDTVQIEFQAACPRNNFRMEETYLTVERKMVSHGWRTWVSNSMQWLTMFGYRFPQSLHDWQVVYTDKDWETKFHWYRKHELSPYSYARIEWSIPSKAKEGIYRIKYFGDSKSLLGKLTPVEGKSKEFVVKG